MQRDRALKEDRPKEILSPQKFPGWSDVSGQSGGGCQKFLGSTLPTGEKSDP